MNFLHLFCDLQIKLFSPAGRVPHDARRMKWHTIDSIVNWLKVQSSEGRSYFILWDQDPAFLAIQLLAVIPADPSESTKLTVTLKIRELPWLEKDEIATSVIRDCELLELWRTERRKLEKSGDLKPLPRPRKPREALHSRE